MSSNPKKPIETINIIEDGSLQADVYFHDILVKDGIVAPAWTFVTRNLYQLGHKELILTLKCQASEVAQSFKLGGRNFPEAVLHLFANIHDDFIESNVENRLDEATWYDWNPVEGSESPYFLGKDRWNAFILGPPDYFVYSDLDGVFVGKTPYLSIQPIFENELTLAKRFGALRIMALLGQTHKHYPWPFYVDRERSSVIPANASLDKLVNNKIFDAGEQVLLSDLFAVFDIEKKSISLRIAQRQVSLLKELIDSLAPTSGFIFNLTFAPDADSHLYWNPSGNNGEYSAITRPSLVDQEARKVKTLGGSFIAFMPRGTSDFVTIHEDGFVAMISPFSWNTLRQCFANGLNCRVASDSEQGLELDLAFVDDDLPADDDLLVDPESPEEPATSSS